jgi:hypothetical protein
MHRLLLLAGLVAGCATPAEVTTTTAATLTITPETPLSREVLGYHRLSAYLQPVHDAWQLVLADAPPGTDCAEASAGPGTLTFFIPSLPPLVAPADGSIAQPIDVAAATTPFGPIPHAELDLVIATRETVGGLYFRPTAAGFAGRFDATTTTAAGLMHVTGAFDAPICGAR